MQMWLDLELFNIGNIYPVKRAKDLKKNRIKHLIYKKFFSSCTGTKNYCDEKKKKKKEE